MISKIDKLFLSSLSIRSCLVSSPSWFRTFNLQQNGTQYRHKQTLRGNTCGVLRYTQTPLTGTSESCSPMWFQRRHMNGLNRGVFRKTWTLWVNAVLVGIALIGGLALVIKLSKEDTKELSTFTIHELNKNQNASRNPQEPKITSITEDKEHSTPTTNELNTNQNASSTLQDTEGVGCMCETMRAIGDFLQNYLNNETTVGVSFAVSVNGEIICEEGFGWADYENNVPCTKDSVFRIASITKPITMAAAAKLYENGHLDLDKPVQYYVPEFPKKSWRGEAVTITTRHLANHKSGIRHYIKEWSHPSRKVTCEKINFFTYGSVIQALERFKDDLLVVKPGMFYYSSRGYDLLGAVIERAAQEPFGVYIQKMLSDLDMKHTYFTEHRKIIPNRVRQYRTTGDNIENAYYEDYSNKWPSEGLSSTVGDLVRFGNIMLKCYQTADHEIKSSSFLSRETVKKMWTIDNNKLDIHTYGMGWKVVSDQDKILAVFHNGISSGGQGFLLILPSVELVCESCKDLMMEEEEPHCPKGIVISLLSNSKEYDPNSGTLYKYSDSLVSSLIRRYLS